MKSSDYMTLVQASKHMRGKRAGQGPHVDSIRRWISEGVKNRLTGELCRLKAVIVSGQLLTTQAWVEEFEAARHARPEVQQPVLRTLAQTTRAAERAGARLDRAGVK